MSDCQRCGERYQSGSKYSTLEYCGTCIFINGSLDEGKKSQPPPSVKSPYPSSDADQPSLDEVTD